MNTSTRLLAALAFSTCTIAHAQSSLQGTVLIEEDFSGGEQCAEPQKWGGSKSWNVPETWEIRDGAIASIYDPKKYPPGKHGKGIDPKFKAHNIRVSYRVLFEDNSANLRMIINAPLRGDSVLWHIGDVVTLPASSTGSWDVTVSERDFTRDPTHPALAGKKLNPAILEKPEGTYGSAFIIPGEAARARLGLVTGKWYQCVVESIGTRWTLWVDGKQAAAVDLKHSDVEKESINFIGLGRFLLDDIVVEELPR